MLKSFFTGALVGYFFGCSKQGVQLRESMDRMVTSLLSNDENTKSEEGQDDFGEQAAEEFRNRFGGKRDKSVRQATKRKSSESKTENGDQSQPTESNSNNNESGVTMEKAMALASALNAKPTAPESDEQPHAHAHAAEDADNGKLA